MYHVHGNSYVYHIAGKLGTQPPKLITTNISGYIVIITSYKLPQFRLVWRDGLVMHTKKKEGLAHVRRREEGLAHQTEIE